MNNLQPEPADLDRPDTWVKHRQKLCASCQGSCCSLAVEVNVTDLVQMGLIDPFEAKEPGKKIAKYLQRQGLIDHFNHKRQIFTLARLANDDCIYLDPKSRLCKIYSRRPATCRNHPRVGPRPGYCAYQPRKKSFPGV